MSLVSVNVGCAVELRNALFDVPHLIEIATMISLKEKIQVFAVMASWLVAVVA